METANVEMGAGGWIAAPGAGRKNNNSPSLDKIEPDAKVLGPNPPVGLRPL